MKVEHVLCLHSSKDGNRGVAEEDLVGEDGKPLMSEKAMKNFSYSLYEVEFNCIVDTETGDIEVKSINVDGGELFTR